MPSAAPKSRMTIPASFKRQPKQDLRIRLETDSTPNKATAWTVTSNTRVHGGVIGQYPKPGEQLRVKASLKGLIHIPAHGQQPVDSSKDTGDDIYTVLDETLLDKSIRVAPGQDGSTTFDFPFSFLMSDFEEQRRLDIAARQDTRLTIPVLPPSTEPRRGNWKTGTHDIERVLYVLVAVVTSGKHILSTTRKEIRYLPFTRPQPPVNVDAFSAEYALSASRNISLERTFEVLCEEPEPLAIRTKDQIGSTRVELMFRLSGKKAAALPREVKAKAALLTRTLGTPHWHGESVPTLEEARTSPNAEVWEVVSHEQAYTMNIEKWEPLDGGRKSDEGRDIFIATLPIRFFIHREFPTPTFFTPSISRRYALALSVSFPESKKSAIKISLPLQIVYTARCEAGSGTTSVERQRQDSGVSLKGAASIDGRSIGTLRTGRMPSLDEQIVQGDMSLDYALMR